MKKDDIAISVKNLDIYYKDIIQSLAFSNIQFHFSPYEILSRFIKQKRTNRLFIIKGVDFT